MAAANGVGFFRPFGAGGFGLRPSPQACAWGYNLLPADAGLEVEQLAKALGLGAADGDLGLLLVVHAQLVAGLEPGHDFADLVDIDDEAAMSAPEARWVEQLKQLLEGAAFGLAFEGARDNANDALVDGGEADVGLIDKQQAALRLHDELARWAARFAVLRTIEQAQKAIDLRIDGGLGRCARRWAACGDARFGSLHGLGHASQVERLEQVIDGVYGKGAHGVLVVG